MKRFIITTIVFLISIQFLYSQDGNNAWTLNGSGMGRIYCGVINPINQNILYVAGLDSGIYKTTNGGLNWFAVNNGVTYKKVQCLAISPSSPDIIYAGTDSLGGANSGVYKTTNGGANWVLAVGGLNELAIQSMVVHTTNPNIVWACTFNAVGPAVVGLWKTTNGGTNWLPSNTGIASDNKNMLAMAINPLNPNVLYAGTSLVLPGSTGPSKIYRTNDGGATWVLSSTGLPTLTTANNPVRAIDVLKSDTSRVAAALFVNDTSGGFYLSINSGQSWTKKHSGLPAVAGSLLRSLSLRSANEFFVGMDGGTTTKGVWRTTNGGNNWIQFTNNLLSNLHPVRMLVFKIAGDTTLYAGTSGTVDSLKGVYEYTWPGTPAFGVPELIYYRFENNPTSTTATNYASAPVGTNPVPVLGLPFASGGQFDTCISGTGGTGSTAAINTGWNWNVTGNWTIGFWVSNLLETSSGSPTYLFGDAGTGTFRCFYGGAALPNNIIFRGPFSATGWTVNVPMPGSYYIHLVWNGSAIVIYKNGVVVSTNPCTNTMPTGTGFKVAGYSTSNYSLNGKMDEFRLYNRALSQAEITATWNTELGVITNITPIGSQIPNSFALGQNYPNPFNPVTKINFDLPKNGLVTLKIYDVLGREMRIVVNEVKTAGRYVVDFDGSSLSSGTYFYRLEAAGFVDTKKMVLIK